MPEKFYNHMKMVNDLIQFTRAIVLAGGPYLGPEH